LAVKLFLPLFLFSSHCLTQNISFNDSSSSLRNQAPLLTELRLLQGTPSKSTS